MLSIITTPLLIILVATVVVAHKTKNRHEKDDARTPLQIVGGNTAKSGDYPYQVSMRYQESHRCGGSIIGSCWVLMAFHCVEDLEADDFYIVAGEVLLSNPGTKYNVDKIIPHEGRNLTELRNDIALLRTKDIIAFNDKVKPIAFEGQGELNGRSAVATGWGLTFYLNQLIYFRTDSLQYLDNVAILSDAECKAKASSPSLINEGSLCAYGGLGKGVCMGDSGGPLVVNGVQWGVVSWGVPCGRGYPDVYMKVSYFAAWIRAKMNEV